MSGSHFDEPVPNYRDFVWWSRQLRNVDPTPVPVRPCGPLPGDRIETVYDWQENGL